LVQILRRDPVAARLSLAGERNVALEHLIGVAANLDARTVALEGLRAVRGARPTVVVVLRHAAAVTAARSILLSWPHDTCLIAMNNGTVGPPWVRGGERWRPSLLRRPELRLQARASRGSQAEVP